MIEGRYILTPNYEKIKDFLLPIKEINEEQLAHNVLQFLLPLEEEWKDYYLGVDKENLYPCCCECVVLSYKKLGEIDKALNRLETYIHVIEGADEYKWKFSVKLDFYHLLATLYFEKQDTLKTKESLRKYVYYFFRQCCNVTYDKFEFFSFRPVTDFLLASLRNNNLTVTDPTEFNDPLDPLLLQHFSYIIEHATTEEDRRFYELQKAIFAEVRIRSLTRAVQLPHKEGRDVKPLAANLREINYTSMWGYYANFHKGICIKYVFPQDFFDTYHNEYVLSMQEVQYLPSFDPRKDTFNFKEAFSAKSDFWSHEHECRLVYYNKCSTQKFVSLPLPEDCVTEIYIGLRTSLYDQWRIKLALSNQPNIKVFQMVLDPTDLFLLIPQEIDRNTWLKDYKPPFKERLKMRLQKMCNLFQIK